MLSFRDYEYEEIPNSPGIYIFRLDVISLSKLCLRGSSGHTENDLVRAKKVLIKKIKLIDKIMSSRRYIGEISESNKKTHNKTSIHINGVSNKVFEYSEIYEKINSVDDVINLIKILEIIVTIIPPLYVGIALEQTLKNRYEQHWYNYLNKKDNCFGGRVSKMGLVWENLAYSAIEIPTGIIQRDLITVCEDLLQGFSKPIFSIM